MDISVHCSIRGKPEKRIDPNEDTGRMYMWCGDKKVNLGYGWIPITAEWDQIYELITVDGLATSAHLSSDHRNEDNFVSRQLIMLDVDNDKIPFTLYDLFEDDFYNKYGAGFYTSPSHTDNNTSSAYCLGRSSQ